MPLAILCEATDTVVARFPGVCQVCGKRIFRGQLVKSAGKYPNSPRRKWQHADCESSADEPTPAVETLPAADSGELRALTDLVLSLTRKVEALETARPRTIEVKRPDAPAVKLEGIVHPAFEEVLQLAAAREHIFLPGPAGCGKSHMAEQVAQALGLSFGSISCSAGMSESQLLGRMVPAGEGGQFVFLGTQFLSCYENGGVFLFDEIDAADSNVLLVINSALANGRMSVPSRHDNPVAKRHPDFVCIAAANTFGRGADRQYVGRNELDESTIDRFRIGTVPMDYDAQLEAQLCPDEAICGRLQTIRQKIAENRLERIVSTRFIAAAYRASRRGQSLQQIESKLFAGWRADEIARVRN